MKVNWKINYIFPTEKPEHIGLKIKNENVEFIFPQNFYSNGGTVNVTEEEIKEDIMLICRYLNKYKEAKHVNDFGKEQIPIESYLWILRNYIINGYYIEKQNENPKGRDGKINWKKTIKNNELYLDEDNIVYKQFITNKRKNNINNIITEINKWCVYDAVKKFGWYYNIINIEKPVINIDNETCLRILKEELSKTFLDSKKILLQNMINIFSGLDQNIYSTQEFEISTPDFDSIFEKLVDEAFGTEDVNKYLPRAEWIINNRETIQASHLTPDTIMKYGKNIYVIDAKNYTYGYTGIGLPQTADINKQITYAENIEINFSDDIDNIYNIFILPYCCNKEELPIKYVGFSKSTWKKSGKKYENVHVVLVDLKKLLNHNLFENKRKNIEKLSNCILIQEEKWRN